MQVGTDEYACMLVSPSVWVHGHEGMWAFGHVNIWESPYRGANRDDFTYIVGLI